MKIFNALKFFLAIAILCMTTAAVTADEADRIKRLEKMRELAQSNSPTNINDRIKLLEDELSYLKLRVSKLEQHQVVSPISNKPLADSEGWKSIKNWRSINKGMLPESVKSILGEPQSVRVSGGFTYWQYPKGKITFYDDKLDGWDEPKLSAFDSAR